MRETAIEYIKSDLYRYYGNHRLITLVKGFIFSNTIRWTISFRMVTKGRKMTKLFGKVINRLFCDKTIQIDFNTQIGYGFYIAHGGPVVVNSTAVIGNNCNLSQFCTIGSNKGKAAVIGDCVYIGPNVCIVENVKIEDYVTVGAGSVVTKDLPKNATAVGNYAKVINFDNSGIYIKNKWDYK